jgi:hypothetical protein
VDRTLTVDIVEQSWMSIDRAVVDCSPQVHWDPDDVTIRVLFDTHGRVIEASIGQSNDSVSSELSQCILDKLALINPNPKMANRVLVFQRVRGGYGRLASGRLHPAIIQAIIRGQYNQLRLCYEQGLARDPKLEGELVTKFRILSDGTTRVISQNAEFPKSVMDCMLNTFATMHFSRHGGEVTVEYPMMFSPQ